MRIYFFVNELHQIVEFVLIGFSILFEKFDSDLLSEIIRDVGELIGVFLCLYGKFA